MSINRFKSFYIFRRCFSFNPLGKPVISALDDGIVEEITPFVKNTTEKLFSKQPVITCMNNNCVNIINRYNF